MSTFYRENTRKFRKNSEFWNSRVKHGAENLFEHNRAIETPIVLFMKKQLLSFLKSERGLVSSTKRTVKLDASLG